jgi:TPR repeat protein
LLEDGDPDAAREWYERAVTAGNAAAMTNLRVLNNLRALLKGSDPRAAP